MSDTTTSPALGEALAPAAPAEKPGRNWVKTGLIVAVVVLLLLTPVWLEAFWLRLGLFWAIDQ